MRYLGIILILSVSSCCSQRSVVQIDNKNTIVAIETTIIEDRGDVQKGLADIPPGNTTEVLTENDSTKENATENLLPEVTTTETFDHSSWHSILKTYVSSEGTVNYAGLKSNHSLLRAYIDELRQSRPTHSWPKNDILAYWINAYNALTIDLILRHYPVNSIKDIKDPWKQRFWKFGDKWYNLDEIEHQILRKMEEPRIHFAIVCASKSCPKLLNEAYTASRLDSQLNFVSTEFLNDPTRNEISENDIRISKIFQWFAKDFKQDGDLIDFLNLYSEIRISEKAKTGFKPYNWDLNE